MKKYLYLIVLLGFASESTASKFQPLENMALSYVLAKYKKTPDYIRDIYLPYIVKPTSNSKNIESYAEVTLKTLENNVLRVQLIKKNDNWSVYRELAQDQLFIANPILIEEYSDKEKATSEKLKKRISMYLQEKLEKKGMVKTVKGSSSRCFVNFNFGKAVCDAWYSTWNENIPECTREVKVFVNTQGSWSEIDGNYHSGMRISSNTGEVIEMFPRQECTR